jgi:hypothetical protein
VIFAISLLLSLGTGAMNTMLVPYVSTVLHGTSATVGWLMSAFGGGLLLGASAYRFIGSRLSLRSLLTVVFPVLSVLFFAAFNIHLTVIVGVLFALVGVPLVCANVATETFVQQQAHDEILGRVASTSFVLQAAGSLVGTVTGAALGQAISPVATTNLAAGIITVAGATALLLPRAAGHGSPARTPTNAARQEEPTEYRPRDACRRIAAARAGPAAPSRPEFVEGVTRTFGTQYASTRRRRQMDRHPTATPVAARIGPRHPYGGPAGGDRGTPAVCWPSRPHAVEWSRRGEGCVDEAASRLAPADRCRFGCDAHSTWPDPDVLALERRGLVKRSWRGSGHNAVVTADGRYYLKHGKHPRQVRAEKERLEDDAAQAMRAPSDGTELVSRLQSASGKITVPDPPRRPGAGGGRRTTTRPACSMYDSLRAPAQVWATQWSRLPSKTDEEFNRNQVLELPSTGERRLWRRSQVFAQEPDRPAVPRFIR